MRLFKIVIFRLKLGFLSTYLPIFFSKTIQNLDVISWVKRYIRIFDVISELYSVLPRRRRRFEKRSHLGQHAISEVWDVTPRNKLDFQKTQRVPPFTISISLSFLSLRYGADFRRSRLVISYIWILSVHIRLVMTYGTYSLGLWGVQYKIHRLKNTFLVEAFCNKKCPTFKWRFWTEFVHVASMSIGLVARMPASQPRGGGFESYPGFTTQHINGTELFEWYQ